MYIVTHNSTSENTKFFKLTTQKVCSHDLIPFSISIRMQILFHNRSGPVHQKDSAQLIVTLLIFLLLQFASLRSYYSLYVVKSCHSPPPPPKKKKILFQLSAFVR